MRNCLGSSSKGKKLGQKVPVWFSLRERLSQVRIIRIMQCKIDLFKKIIM